MFLTANCLSIEYYTLLCDIDIFYVCLSNHIIWTIFYVFAIKYKFIGDKHKLDMILFTLGAFVLAIVPEIIMLTYRYFQK